MNNTLPIGLFSDQLYGIIRRSSTWTVIIEYNLIEKEQWVVSYLGSEYIETRVSLKDLYISLLWSHLRIPFTPYTAPVYVLCYY